MAKKKKEENINKVEEYSEYPIYSKSIGEITEEAYIRFGGYISTSRALPRVADGLKISYLRLFHHALTFPLGKLIPTNSLLGKISETHPHSTDGLVGTVSMFVNSGIFKGYGSFGKTYIDGKSAPPAAPRYTKVSISDVYIKLLGELYKEVPWKPSPNEAPEPSYIPVPLPLCLMMSERVQGLAVAIKCDMPNFSAKSMYEAYINNNPQLLEPNMDLILDKSRSDLNDLWTKGKGKVTYSYHLARQRSDDGKTEGVLFYGDTGMFTISMKKLQKWIDEGKVTVDNVSDQNGTKLLVSRVPGARGITIEDIEKVCEKICYDSTVYSLNVTDGHSAFRIPLYAWLDYTYKNYISLITSVNNKKILQVEHEIRIQEALPYVVDYILTKNSKADNDEISKALGLDKEVVSGVMSKPIGYLRKNKDTSERVKELKKRLTELGKFDPILFTHNVIQEL